MWARVSEFFTRNPNLKNFSFPFFKGGGGVRGGGARVSNVLQRIKILKYFLWGGGGGERVGEVSGEEG